MSIAVQMLVTVMLWVALPGSAAALSDPTRPQDLSPAKLESLGIVMEEAEPTYTLQYVLYSDRRRLAVINGQRVREGDRVDDARVLLIRPGEVRIGLPGEIRALKLGFTDIKKKQGRDAR